MAEWPHRLNGYEFEQTPGDDEGDGKPGVLPWGPWGRKELDMTERLNKVV